MELGAVGVWWSARSDSSAIDAQAAKALEDLGYGAIWSSGRFDPGIAPVFEQLLEGTERVVVASGIVSIWVNQPAELARAVAAVVEAHGDRFLLGLGASHAALVEGYERPYSHMVAFLDALDRADPTVDPSRRVLAALGPKMLDLSARRAAGAHPYFVPVEHTRRAREVLGAGPLLAPEVTVVLERDADRARTLARTFTAGYLSLPNYADNLRSLGFTDDDVRGAGSDRLVDAVVAWGDAAAVADRVRAHHDAGADHVCIQVVPAGDGFPLAEYRALAEQLL